MEGKASFIILIAIVAFLSLSLALLGGYVFFIQKADTTQADSEAAKVEQKRPADTDLAKIQLYEEKERKKIFNLKTDDPKKTPILQINGFELVYYKTVPGIKIPLQKINDNKSDLREIVSKYFQNVTAEEVKSSAGRERIQEELLNRMNDFLKSNEKSKNDLLYDIVIEDWIYTG